MMNSVRVLCGFVFGLLVMGLMVFLANFMDVAKPLLWASGACFLITLAVIAGMWVIGTEWAEAADREDQRRKAARERREIANYGNYPN